jgi:integrase
MGHIEDRWTVPGPSGRRVRGPRYGQGKRWRARWTDPDGRTRSKACASADEARALIARVSVQVADGTYVQPSSTTVQQYAELWLSHQLQHRASTAEHAERALRRRVYPVLGSVPLARVRRSDVQALVTDLATREDGPLAASTVRVTYTYLAAVFRSAVDDRLIAASPCSRIRLPEVQDRKVVPLTVEQVEAMTAAAGRWRAMFITAAGTGLRPGELRGLCVDRITPALHVRGGPLPKVASIRVDQQLVNVLPGGVPVFGPPKTPASVRTVTVGPVVIAAIARHLAEHGVGRDGLVFVDPRGRPVSRERARVVWGDATDGMGLRPRSGWHDLRHFHASLLIRAGLSVRAVADRLGHADPTETLRTYSHLWPDDEDRAREAIQRALGGLG